MTTGVVLYASLSGHTKQYAKLIGAELEFDVRDARKTRIGSLADYQTIVFGGGLYHNRIDGIRYILDNFSYFYDQNLIIFSVGVEPIDDELIASVKARNFPDYFRRSSHYRPLPGSFDPADIKKGLLHRSLAYTEMENLKLRASQNRKLTRGERLVLEALENNESIDGFDEASIASIVTAAQLND